MDSKTQTKSGEAVCPGDLLARTFYCAIPNRAGDKIVYVVPIEIMCRMESGQEIITDKSMKRIESVQAFHKILSREYGVIRADDPEYLAAIKP